MSKVKDAKKRYEDRMNYFQYGARMMRQDLIKHLNSIGAPIAAREISTFWKEAWGKDEGLFEGDPQMLSHNWSTLERLEKENVNGKWNKDIEYAIPFLENPVIAVIIFDPSKPRKKKCLSSKQTTS